MFGKIVEDSFLEKMNNIRLAAAACRSEQEKLRFTVSVGCVVRENGQTISFEDVDKQLYIARRLNNAVASGNKVLYCEGSSFRTRVHETARVFPVPETVDSLMKSFNSILVVDLKENTTRVFKESLVVPEMNVEGKNYSELVKEIIHMVAPEHKKELYKLSEVGYVQKTFRNIDRREMVFKMLPKATIWKKVTMSVIERQDGEAVTMAYCFSDLDYYRSKELEYNKLIEEHEEVLERTVRERTMELSQTNRQLRKLNEQIVGIADCFDALTSKRPYKDAFDKEDAFRMILNGECGVFSDKLLECFVACKEEFLKRK